MSYLLTCMYLTVHCLFFILFNHVFGLFAGLGSSVGKVSDYQSRGPGFDSPGTTLVFRDLFLGPVESVGRRHGVDLKLCLCAVS